MHKFTLFSLNIIVISEKNVIFALKIDEIVTFANNKYKIKNINTKL